MRPEIALTPRESVSIHLPDNMRPASVLATQGQARRASIVSGQSNLAIPQQGQATADAASILGERERGSTNAQRPQDLLLSRAELASFKRDPHDFIDTLSTFSVAEEASMKPVVNEAASSSDMIWPLLKSGAIGWMSSFWIGGMVDEAARFADPYVAEYGIPPGLLSSIGNPIVGATLAVLVSGPTAGGIRSSQGSRPSPDDGNLANLATLRAQKFRAFFSCSPDYYKDLDKATVAQLALMAKRNEQFAGLLKGIGSVGRSWITDDLTYLPWHVLLSIGALTAPHLIDSHYGPDLADRLAAAGWRVLYRVPFGVGSSDSTALLQHLTRPRIQKTEDPKKGINSPEGQAAHLAALETRKDLLSFKIAKLDELRIRIMAQIRNGLTTREDAQLLLDHIEAKREALGKATSRVTFKLLKMRSASGRNWLLIQNMASTLYKGKNKTLPPHLKGVLTEGALKIRSVATVLGCCTTLTAGNMFSYFNVSHLGPRPDPHVEGITWGEAALVITNTVVLMELWKLRSPLARYFFEPLLNVGVGMAEGTANAVSTVVNWCCSRHREDLAARSGRMQYDLENPVEQPEHLASRDSTSQMLQQFTDAADLMLQSDGGVAENQARFSDFLNRFAAKATRDGDGLALKKTFDALPPEALELVVDSEFLNEGQFRGLAQLARNCLLDRVDRRIGVNEVKGEQPDGDLDTLTNDDREQIEAYLFDNAITSNLWPAVYAEDPAAMRSAYAASKNSVLNLLRRTEPAYASLEGAEERVLKLLESFWTSPGEEFPQLVETLFDSLPREELDSIIARSAVLQFPAQQGLRGRVKARNDGPSEAFDTAVLDSLGGVFAGKVLHGQASAQYRQTIGAIGRQFPGEDEVGVRGMLMDSLADLLATLAVSTLQVRRLFSTLSNGELNAIRTYRSAPGAQTTRQQGNIMQIATECLAQNTGEQAGATADAFAGWIDSARQADFRAGYEHQLTNTGMQLQLAELPDTTANRREWLMDSIALALKQERIDEDKLVALFGSLSSQEREAIVARAPGVHAPDLAYRVTLNARSAATQRRKVLAEAANVAFQRALETEPDQMTGAVALAATAYEEYSSAVLPGAIEAPFDNELEKSRTTLLARIGGDHSTLSDPAKLTRPPT